MTEQEQEVPEQPDEPEAEQTEEPGEDDEQLADEPGGDDEEQAETDEQPDEQPAMTEKDIEAFWKGMDKYRGENADRVAKRAGDAATDLIPCPCCGSAIPGFVFDPRSAPPHPEVVAAVRVYIGMPDLELYEQAQDAQPCPDCKAKGWVKTGSEVENYTIKQCSRCVGKGYVGTGVMVQPESGFTTNGATEPVPYTPAAQVESDLPPELQAYRDKGYFIMPPGTGVPG